MDMSLLERVNPIYNTAKMTLCGLAQAGDRDAAVIIKKLGLTPEKPQDSAQDPLSAIQSQANAVFLEIRFRTMGALAENADCRTIVDLTCGYTPRGLQTARKGRRYIGLDLPATVSEMERVIMPLCDDEQRSLIKYASVDATNYVSLKTALEGECGPVCVTTEGLLMYFNDSVASALCDNIRRLLIKYGGCWITSDPEMMVQNALIMRAIAGERYKEVMNNLIQAFESKADIHVDVPALMIRPLEEMTAERERALSFLSGHGLKAERMTVGCCMPEIESLHALKPEAAEAVRTGMEQCAYWKITLSDDVETVSGEGDNVDFRVQALLTEGRFDLYLSGRMDTLTAPRVLELFEKRRRI
ncbi:MAG: hypothetical protein K5668_06945 [Lachnospiraceae bacterium]|nr:hypothetical protein [Lachnospiraceae bacterium]